MGFAGDVWSWLTDSANWSGPDGIVLRATEHIQISFSAVLAAMLVAIPIGLYVGHTRRFELFAITTGNLGRALPSFGILAICFGLPFFAQLPGVIGYWPTFAALFLLAVPPILTNTYVGVRQIDPEIVDAAHGIGMNDMQVIRHVRLPLAMPTIFAGVRTSAVSVVATATIAPLANVQTLGEPIITPQTYGIEGGLGAAMVVTSLRCSSTRG